MRDVLTYIMIAVAVLIVLRIILIIHEVYLIYKWTHMDKIETGDEDLDAIAADLQDKVRKNLSNKEDQNDKQESTVDKNLNDKYVFYGPFIRKNAFIRAQHGQFMENSIICIYDEKNYLFRPYMCKDEFLTPIDLVEYNNSEAVEPFLRYLYKNLRTSQDIDFVGMFTEKEVKDMDIKTLYNNRIIGVYVDNSKKTYRLLMYKDTCKEPIEICTFVSDPNTIEEEK